MILLFMMLLGIFYMISTFLACVTAIIKISEIIIILVIAIKSLIKKDKKTSILSFSITGVALVRFILLLSFYYYLFCFINN